MKTPHATQKAIYVRLQEIERITNPTDDMFTERQPHALDAERDTLVKIWHEYQRYKRWFERAA